MEPTIEPTIDGTYNFRDVGIGPTMRRGLYYRSDNIKGITDLGVSQLSDLGVRTLIDLRSIMERSNKGNVAVPSHMRDLHFPLFMAEGMATFDNTVIEFLTHLLRGPIGYCELFMVVCDNPFLVKVQWLPIFELLASSDAVDPLVIFCAAGKDRTGLLSALIQLLGNASHQLIIEDFAKTAQNIPPMDLTLLRSTMPSIKKLVEVMNPSDNDLAQIFASEPKSMELFLVAFHQKYGNIENFFLSKIGMTKRQFEQMKRNVRVPATDAEGIAEVLSHL